jgi:hypothetical protein
MAVVSGTVTAAPTCPVERVGHPCPARDVVATVRAAVGTRVVASTTSKADGTYRLKLPTGMYTISAATVAAFPRCNPKPVKVVAPAPIEASIVCDTGIR